MIRISIKGFILTLIISLIIAITIVFIASGSRIFIVFSDSMEPTIPPGSLVIVVPTWIKSPEVGDVVAYRLRIDNHASMVIVHRIVAKYSEDMFITKGDAVQEPDPWIVNRSDIIGVVVFSIPFIGTAMLFIAIFAPAILVGIATYQLSAYIQQHPEVVKPIIRKFNSLAKILQLLTNRHNKSNH